jgi:hypothetical protein
MPFLTKEKTNWKYILIISVLAVIVGGGILVYLRYFENEIISLTKYPEIKKQEKSKVEEVANWKTYRNKEYSFEFEYPQDWGDIIPSTISSEDFIFYVSNEKIRIALYRIKSRNLFFIEQDKVNKDEGRGEMVEKILKVMFQDKEIKELYRFKPLGIFEREDYWDKIIRAEFIEIKFSPDEKYIAFMVPGWEFDTPVLMNIYTGTDILSIPISKCYEEYNKSLEETFEHSCIILTDTWNLVYWSPQGKVVAIRGYALPWETEDLGVVGGLFVSDYNNPEKLNPVVCLDTAPELQLQTIECGILKYYKNLEIEEGSAEISDIRFITDERLLFTLTVNEKTTKYEYYPETKELKEKE